VPTLLAMLASSVVAWILDDLIRGATGASASMLLGTIAGGVAFFLVRRFMSDLRAGS
jgi:outer membrane lipoprotein SlyB